MSSCPSLQCLSVRAGIEIQLSPSVTKVKRAASKSLSTSVSHHPTTFQQTELANNLCKLKHTNINIQRELPAARCCTGEKSVSRPGFALVWDCTMWSSLSGNQAGCGAVCLDCGSRGTTQLWPLSSKGVSLPGEVYLKGL